MALKKAVEHVHYEDENNRYMCIGCVKKVLCLIACWVEDPNSDAYKRHLARMTDYFWLPEDGLNMQVIFQPMFTCQFLVLLSLRGTMRKKFWLPIMGCNFCNASNLAEEYMPTLKNAHEFIKASQVNDNPSGSFTEMYRHISKGARTFATQDHGWQVSNCIAEGLKCALLFAQMPPELFGEKSETKRFYNVVKCYFVSTESKWWFPAWETQRAFRWMEKFNPTWFFEDILIKQEYVECTSSAIQGLALFKKWHPDYQRKEKRTAFLEQ